MGSFSRVMVRRKTTPVRRAVGAREFVLFVVVFASVSDRKMLQRPTGRNAAAGARGA